MKHTLMETLSKHIKDKMVMGVLSIYLEMTDLLIAFYGKITGFVDERSGHLFMLILAGFSTLFPNILI